AAGKVRDKALRLAADLLEVGLHDLEVSDGAVSVKGVPDRRLALGALATVANPIRYAYGKEAAEAALRLVKPRQGAVLRDGEEPGLEARGYYAPPHATFASGCHAALVDADVETGAWRRGSGARSTRSSATTRPDSRSRGRSWSSTSRRRPRCHPSTSCTSRPSRPSIRSASRAWARRARSRCRPSWPRRSRTRSRPSACASPRCP